MDEYSQGMDPEVKLYFRKIMKTFGVGLFWLLLMGTAGLFFKLAFVNNGLHWYNLAFYSICLISLVFVIQFFYRVWYK